MRRIWQANPASLQTPVRPSIPEQSPHKLPAHSLHSQQFEDDTTHADTMEEEPELFRDNFDEVADIARKSYRLVKYALGELNTEHKMLQGFTPGLLPDSSGITIDSNIIANAIMRGAGDAERTGDSLKIQNFWIRGMINHWSGVTGPAFDTNYYIRCVVYWQPGFDQQTRAFASGSGTSDGFFEYNYAGQVVAPLAPKDYDTDANNEVLYDKLWTINRQQLSHEFKALVKVDRKTQFEDGGMSSDQIATGTLRICFISNVPASDIFRPQVDYIWRTYYVDN